MCRRALVALRQAFTLEKQYGEDGERLCKACAALCRALSRVPSGPPEAVTPLLQALDTLDARAIAAGQPHAPNDSPHFIFLARELFGLARKLCGSTTPSGVSTARLDELRAADRAYERLAQLSKTHEPLRLSTATELSLTPEECFYQLANAAERAGVLLLRSSASRDREAACFYLQRASRKLRLAGVGEKDAKVLEVATLLATAEQQLRLAQQPPKMAPVVEESSATASTTSAVVEACLVQ